MSKDEESDLICFDEIRQTAKRMALTELSQFIESLEVNNLQQKERDGRIYREIGKVVEAMKGYSPSPYPYITYTDDPNLLFLIYNCIDPFNHPEILDRFKLCMILQEKYNILYLLFMGNREKELAENFSAMPQAPQPNQRNEQNRLIGNLPWQNIYLPYASGLFTREMISSLPKAEPTVEEILTMIVTKMNERINYLKYESDILKLVGIILNPTSVEKGVEILLGCKTTEFKYSIPHLQSYNKVFTYANIGRACCIISKKGNLITSRNLGSTSCKNINTRHAIDNIFAEFRKKYGFH